MSELSVDIKATTDAAVSQVKKLGSTFEDTATDMEKLVDAGKDLGKSTDDISRDLSKVSGRPFDEVRRDVERAEDAIDDMADQADDARQAVARIGDAGQSAGREGAAGMDRMRVTSAEVGQEIRQNLGEGIANAARGDFAALGDTIGDTLGGAVAGMGGLGAAGVAAAGAVGLGAIVAVFQAMQAEAEATEQRVSDMYNDMLESGQAFLSADFIQKSLGEIGDDTGKYNQALQIAKDLNVEINDVVRAMAGDTIALTGIIEDQNSKRQTEVDAINDSNLSLDDKAIKLDAINAKYGTQNDVFNDIIGAQDSAAARFETINAAQSQALYDLAIATGTATGAVDDLGNAIYVLPDGKEVVVDAATQEAHVDLDAVENKRLGNKYVSVKVGVDDSAYVNWQPRAKFATVFAGAGPGIKLDG